MTKLLSADLTTGTDTLMRIVGLAKKKGITIVDLSVKAKDEDNFSIELHYKEKDRCNFHNSVYNIQGVYNINNN